MDPQQFDRLVRGVTRSASRRRALGGLLGGVLATLASTGEAKRRHHRHGMANDATKAGNRDCAHFCTTIFPPGPQRGQCISDAAHGNGLCAHCQADPANFCNGACCTGGQTCQTGHCAAIGQRFHCVCGDTSSQNPCLPAPCQSVEDVVAVCTAVCAPLGGFYFSAQCDPGDTCALS